jgi:hypothetical protein
MRAKCSRGWRTKRDSTRNGSSVRRTPCFRRAEKQEFAELGDAPLDGIRARGADYVVIQAFGERYRYKVLLRLLEELREKAERVFVAAPRADGEESGRVWIREKMTLNQVPTWLRVFQDRSMGTVLEIYRVPKESAR